MDDDTPTPAAPRGRIRRVLALLILMTGLLVLVLPRLVCLVPWPEMTFDLTDDLGANASLFARRTVRFKPVVSRRDGGFRIAATGRLLDWPFSATASVRFGFLSARGSVEAAIGGTPWRVKADFDAPSTREWSVSLRLPETEFSERDGVIAPILARLDLSSVSNLVFSGSVAVDAEAAVTRERPVTTWSAKAALKGVDAELSASDVPIAVRGLSCNVRASGIADHCDISPLHPRASSLEIMTIPLTNFYATVYSGERHWLVTEAGAGCGGGNLRAYSVSVNPETLSSGFTLVLDGVDAGAVLARVTAFDGEATGRLNGKIQIFLRNGEELRLKESYLYSIPGETGTIRISDAKPLLAGLAAGGVSESECANLSKVLSNLDYDLLKVNLRREGAESMSLNLVLDGSATSGATTVPAAFDITFHGALNELINLGLKAKGKQQ